MSSENDPIRIQMRGYIGLARPRIFEHKGESGTNYVTGQKVETGNLTLEFNGAPIGTQNVLSVTHVEEKTQYEQDGVPVKVVFTQITEAAKS